MEHGSSSSTQEVKRSRVGQPERANCWMFTINNPGISGGELCQSLRSSIESAVRDSAGKGLSYFVFQLERGAEGTEHFQGYLEHSSRVSRPALLGILGAAHDSCKGAYLEPRRSRSADACISYCSKVDTRIDGPWSGGSPSVSPGQGARTDLKPLVGALNAAAGGASLQSLYRDFGEVMARHGSAVERHASILAPPRRTANVAPKRVVILFGPAGCGKTHTARDDAFSAYAAAFPDDAAFILNGGGSDLGRPLQPDNLWVSPVKGELKWFDGYRGQTHALLDDFDGWRSNLIVTTILRLFDVYNVFVEVKGSTVFWTPSTIYVTTNYHPKMWFNWTHQEVHWHALLRRITEVWHWKKQGCAPVVHKAPEGMTSGEAELRASSCEEWFSHPFWAGPPGQWLADDSGKKRFVPDIDEFDF